jgi:phage/conjugal plasmid C-4 type zinc finger TraR family protein
MMINNDLEQFEYNNEEEAEIAQIRSLQLHQKAVGAVQQKLAEQRKYESLHECIECGDEIPEARRVAVKGCTLCIFCQQLEERRSKGL